MPFRPFAPWIWIALAAALGAGCPPKQEVRPDPVAAPAPPPPPAAEASKAEPPPAEEAKVGLLDARPIYFGLDSSTLADEGRAELRRVAGLLEKRPEARVTIAGHTCELGTSEYNLALGQRRAQSSRDYLVRLGVRAERIETISYGEERPAAEGEGEDVWSKNRRCELRFAEGRAQGGE